MNGQIKVTLDEIKILLQDIPMSNEEREKIVSYLSSINDIVVEKEKLLMSLHTFLNFPIICQNKVRSDNVYVFKNQLAKLAEELKIDLEDIWEALTYGEGESGQLEVYKFLSSLVNLFIDTSNKYSNGGAVNQNLNSSIQFFEMFFSSADIEEVQKISYRLGVIPNHYLYKFLYFLKNDLTSVKVKENQDKECNKQVGEKKESKNIKTTKSSYAKMCQDQIEAIYKKNQEVFDKMMKHKLKVENLKNKQSKLIEEYSSLQEEYRKKEWDLKELTEYSNTMRLQNNDSMKNRSE